MKIECIFAISCLVISIVIGAGYRAKVLNERFKYQIGNMGWALSMASTYNRAPGLYNNKEAERIINSPGEYIYKSNADHKLAKSSLRTDIGYPFILRQILKDDIKGVDKIARHIARYQMMVDLFVIIVLFFAGYRILNATCASIAAFLYAVFKIPMVQMSFVEYYYWPIPLSALILLGLTFIFSEKNNHRKFSMLSLFTYFFFGLLIGFSTYIRLIFFNVSFLFLPLIFLRELTIQKEELFNPIHKKISIAAGRSLVLFLLILIGQMFFVLPICFYNYVYHDKFALSDRQFWHLPLQGIGHYKNRWGIVDSGDVSINEWAMARGAPSYMGQPPDVIAKAEVWHKKAYISMVKEDPKFFIKNFFKNFRNGLTVSKTDFVFYGIFGSGSSFYKFFVKVFPWLLLSSLFIIWFKFRNKFLMTLAVITHGIYLLLIVVTWWWNFTLFITGYIPVFIMILSIILSVHLTIFFSYLASFLNRRISLIKHSSYRITKSA